MSWKSIYVVTAILSGASLLHNIPFMLDLAQAGPGWGSDSGVRFYWNGGRSFSYGIPVSRPAPTKMPEYHQSHCCQIV